MVTQNDGSPIELHTSTEQPSYLPVPSATLDYGLFEITAFYCLRHLFSTSAKSNSESWELLEKLVKSLQETNTVMLETNQMLAKEIARLAENQKHGS